MTLLFNNFASGVLSADITDSQTSVGLTVGDGDAFPVLGASDYCIAVIEDVRGNKEVVKITDRAGDVLIIERAQEGTTARSFLSGSRLELRPTTGFLEEFIDAGEFN